MRSCPVHFLSLLFTVPATTSRRATTSGADEDAALLGDGGTSDIIMIATPPPTIKKPSRKQLPDAPAGISVGPLETYGPVLEYVGGDGPTNSQKDHPFFFTVTGKPAAMPRPRMGKHGVYMPFDWKSCKMLMRVKEHVENANKSGHMSFRFPIKKEEWVSISVTYRIQRPNHHFGKTRDRWNIKPQFLNARPTCCDVDNYL